MSKGQYQAIFTLLILASLAVSVGVVYQMSTTQTTVESTTTTVKATQPTTTSQNPTSQPTSTTIVATTTVSTTSSITTSSSAISTSITSTTTAIPECKCSWFTCSQNCGYRSGGICLFDSNCFETSTTMSTTTSSSTTSTSTTTVSTPTTFTSAPSTISSSTTTTTPVITEFIKVASDNWHFETSQTHQSFVPFGCNYFDPSTLSTPYYVGFAVIRKFNAANTDRHFQQLQDLGVNTIRILLSIDTFEPQFKVLNQTSFQTFDNLIQLAKNHNLRVVVDLFENWDGPDSLGYPYWMDEPEYHRRAIAFDNATITEGLAFLAQSFGQRYANEPTIMAWNLINEPNNHWEFLSVSFQDWVHAKYGNENNLKLSWADYPKTGESWNNIYGPLPNNNLNYARLFDYQLMREDIAYNWTKKMVDAIRLYDNNHLITLGNLPYDVPLRMDPNAGDGVWYYPAFNPRKLSSVLDYISLHGYDSWDSNTSLYVKGLLRYSYNNKPVVIEEFYYDDSVVDKTLDSSSGWLAWSCYHWNDWTYSFFDQNEQMTALGNSFKNRAATIKDKTLVRSNDAAVINLDLKKVLTDLSQQNNVYNEYIAKAQTTQGPVGFNIA